MLLITLLLVYINNGISTQEFKGLALASEVPKEGGATLNANLQLVQAYATSLSLEWQDDIENLDHCALQAVTVEGDRDSKDCASAYDLGSTGLRVNFLLSNDKHKDEQDVSSCIRNGKTKNPTAAKATKHDHDSVMILKNASDFTSEQQMISVMSNGSFVRFFNLTGLQQCHEYDLDLCVTPFPYNSSSNSSHAYTGELCSISTTADYSVPPASLNCFLADDVIFLNWSQPIEKCMVYNYSVSWTARSLWSNESDSDNLFVEGLKYTVNSILIYADYTFEVFAVYDSFNGSSVPATVKCTTQQEKSSPPQNVSVEEIQADSITIEWSTPDTANGLIESYQVDYTRSSSGDNVSSVVSFITTATVAGLEECVEYEFNVSARNGAGLGEPSDPVVTPTANQKNPNLELNCTLEDSSITMAWNAAYGNDCSESQYIIQYNYTVTWNDDTYNSDSESVNQDNYFIIPAEDTLPGTDYSIRLSLESDPGLYDNCSITTEDAKSKEPAIMGIFTTATSIYVEWCPPMEANGIITGYNVSYQEKDCQACTQYLPLVTQTSVNITEEIQPCTGYYVQVAAINGAGSGDAASSESTTKDPGPTNILCIPKSSSQILLTWDLHPNCDETSYEVVWQGSSLWETNVTFDGSTSLPCSSKLDARAKESSSSCAVTGLHPYSEYQVCLHSNSSGENFCCNSTTQEDKSTPPVIESSGATSSLIYVSWSPPLEANGLILHYNITYSNAVNISNSWSKIVIDDTALNTTEAVMACSAYTVDVVAVNGYGNSDPSSVDLETGYEGVTTINCKVNSSSEIYLWWKEPGYCGEDGYLLAWDGYSLWEDDVRFNDSSFITGSVDSFTLKELHPYTEYEICLISNTPEGEARCCNCSTEEGTPSEPQSLSVADVSRDSLTLSWREPETWNGCELGYLITYDNKTIYSTEEKASLLDLESDTTYNIFLAACNGGACSAPASQEATTGADEGTDNTVLIISLSVAIVTLIVLIVVIVIVLRKKINPTSHAPHAPEPRNREVELPLRSFEERNPALAKKKWSPEDVTSTIRL